VAVAGGLTALGAKTGVVDFGKLAKKDVVEELVDQRTTDEIVVPVNEEPAVSEVVVERVGWEQAYTTFLTEQWEAPSNLGKFGLFDVGGESPVVYYYVNPTEDDSFGYRGFAMLFYYHDGQIQEIELRGQSAVWFIPSEQKLQAYGIDIGGSNYQLEPSGLVLQDEFSVMNPENIFYWNGDVVSEAEFRELQQGAFDNSRAVQIEATYQLEEFLSDVLGSSTVNEQAPIYQETSFTEADATQLIHNLQQAWSDASWQQNPDLFLPYIDTSGPAYDSLSTMEGYFEQGIQITLKNVQVQSVSQESDGSFKVNATTSWLITTPTSERSLEEEDCYTVVVKEGRLLVHETEVLETR